MRLQTKLMLLICTLLSIVIIGLSWTFHAMWMSTMKTQAGEEALRLAKVIANMDQVKQAFEKDNPTAIILPLVEQIRLQTEAEFIVVGDEKGIRIAHPVADRIGKPMVGGDNDAVFRGEAIISEAVGSLGASLRGKAPIIDHNNRIIGVVSVGFLKKDIKEEVLPYQLAISGLAALAILLGVGGAVIITKNVKKSIHGLEPVEIGRLYQEKQTLLESIREGIIAINEKGYITTMNPAAFELMGLQPQDITGVPITTLFPQTTLMEVIESKRSQYDVEFTIGDRDLVANRVPILNSRNQVIGAVSSFRNKSDMFMLTEQLSQLRNYADGLRSQTHEFSNKLHLIAGLIQLESYSEALDLIAKESNMHQNFMHFMMEEIPDPIVAGLLIGKFNRAHEVNVELQVDAASSFKNVPEYVDRNKLVTIIGNLIDNALEAVHQMEQERLIRVFLSDTGNELMIEVEDSGSGIPPAYGDNIFNLGFTTKIGEHRGFGLSLVKQAVEQLGGMIHYHTREEGLGAVFVVIIPKESSMGESEEDHDDSSTYR
ncbi:ATP-binding protein [Paenibacillus arenosi]|uniref:histidine kinase n=1 Tax=Paenibacillus arenosi TaxID=2774142 RepID=A0ABR9B2E4_9BACL|nr:sensor histidine kinase [Paenibacillus arenosi]MBD8500153.1 sensor histidine kinase [Paenibacillus arenosi]